MHSIFSFFTGAGFLDLGFEHAGFSVDMVNEFNPEFLRGYRHARSVLGSPAPAYGHHLGSVEEMLSPSRIALLRSLIADARRQGRKVGFIGGPPCPDFSIAGKNAGGEGDNGRLTGVYFQLINAARPDFFVFENVEGLWRTKMHRQFYDDRKAEMVAAGYVLNDKLTNSICYGVPQDRSRIFLVGCLDGDASAEFPWEIAMTHDESVLKAEWPTMDAFSADSRTEFPGSPGTDIELTIQRWFERNDVANHPNARQYFSPKSNKFTVIPEGSTQAKSFKRLHRWRYSPTACYGNNEVHLHPYEARRISVAEALAIQSLPKEFMLPNDMTLSSAFKTIGNGVPYLAARGLARSISSYLEQCSGSIRGFAKAA
jgi:DNA (cytosine-5)-methyltransferase 1